MQLLDPATTRAFLGLEPNPEEDQRIIDGRADPFGDTDWTAEALAWAQREYPQASAIDQHSFAGLLAYLVTGWYGGYGTEEYSKEQQILDLVLGFAGGLPAEPGSIISHTPPLDERGGPVLPFDRATWTKTALDLMRIAYFVRDPRAAVEEAGLILQRVPGQFERLGAAREGVLRVVEKYGG